MSPVNIADLGARRVGKIGNVQLIHLDLNIQNLFGPLGPERYVTLHWTAGPKDDSLRECLQLCLAYHRYHASKGWGGIAYHFCLPRTTPAIILLRPITLKGAHVGGWNTSNVGVVTHGGAGGRANPNPNDNQVEALRALLRYGHTRKMPGHHRADRKLARPYCDRRAHKDWPGHAWNQCNGTYRPLINLRTR